MARRTGAVALLLMCGALCALAPRPSLAAEPGPSFGAIATFDRSYGYSFNHPTREAAEQAARAQCDRAARRPGGCIVGVWFDRACGAIALGNYGEWGVATALTASAAEKTAAAQCDGHLPTEPCKTLISACSPK